MAPQLRRRPASIVTSPEAVQDPPDLGEPFNLDDYSFNSPNSPNFDPELPSYPVIASPPRTALSERFIAHPRLPSLSPSPAHPPPLPLHNTPDFIHPHALTNYLDSSPSENEDEAYEADAQDPCRPLPSLSPSPSISRSPPHIVDRSSFVDNQPEKEQHDELSWQQVRKLPFEEQDDWHKRRIQKRKEEYQDVMDQPIKTQQDHPQLSAQEVRKATTERKNLLNKKQMQVTRAKASRREMLARHDQGQHHSRNSPGDQFAPSSPSSSPITLSQNRFFPRGRRIGSNHSPSDSLRDHSSSPSREHSKAGSSSEEEEGDTDDGSDPSPRSKHSTRPPASSGSRNPGKSRQAHEAIIQELDRQMEKLKAERRQEVEKRRKERCERNKDDDLKKSVSTRRNSRKGPEAHKYNNARQSIYQRKKRAEDAYERDFRDYSERRTTPKELQKHKYIPKVGRGAAERARRGRTK